MTRSWAAVISEELMLKLVLPREKELLFTYSMMEEEYVGVMTKADRENPITAAKKPAPKATNPADPEL